MACFFRHKLAKHLQQFLLSELTAVFYLTKRKGWWICFEIVGIVLVALRNNCCSFQYSTSNVDVKFVFAFLIFLLLSIWRTGLMKYTSGLKIRNLVGEEIRMHCWLLASTLLVDKKKYREPWKVHPMIFLIYQCFPGDTSPWSWWISNRNLLNCQWSHQEGNWPSKRIHSEATGFGEWWSKCRNGNNTCWGLHGQFSLVLCTCTI